MNDIERGVVSNVTLSSNVLSFKLTILKDDGTTVDEMRNLKLDTTNKVIYYGKYNGGFVTGDVSYYTKKLESSLNIGNMENCSNLTNGYFCVKIPIDALYSSENYDVKLFSSNIN